MAKNSIRKNEVNVSLFSLKIISKWKKGNLHHIQRMYIGMENSMEMKMWMNKDPY